MHQVGSQVLAPLHLTVDHSFDGRKVRETVTRRGRGEGEGGGGREGGEGTCIFSLLIDMVNLGMKTRVGHGAIEDVVQVDGQDVQESLIAGLDVREGRERGGEEGGEGVKQQLIETLQGGDLERFDTVEIYERMGGDQILKTFSELFRKRG